MDVRFFIFGHFSKTQEFLAALYLTEEIESDADTVKNGFCKLRAIFDHKVVLQFCCGLSVKAGKISLFFKSMNTNIH